MDAKKADNQIITQPVIFGDLTLSSPTTQTTVGAAGGGSALPATPIGYLIVNIGTTAVKIPYYTV
jgi:hypothetical protein